MIAKTKAFIIVSLFVEPIAAPLQLNNVIVPVQKLEGVCDSSSVMRQMIPFSLSNVKRLSRLC